MDEQLLVRGITALKRRGKLTLAELSTTASIGNAYEFMLQLLNDGVICDTGNGVFKLAMDKVSLNNYPRVCKGWAKTLSNKEIAAKRELLTWGEITIISRVIEVQDNGASVQYLRETDGVTNIDDVISSLVTEGLIGLYKDKYYCTISHEDLAKLLQKPTTTQDTPKGAQANASAPSIAEAQTSGNDMAQAQQPSNEVKVILVSKSEQDDKNVSITVMVLPSDTPMQVISKAIMQCNPMRVLRLFARAADILTYKRDRDSLVQSQSIFALISGGEVDNLDWTTPIENQTNGRVSAMFSKGETPQFAVYCTIK